MRLKLPTRLPLKWVFAYMVVMLIAQLIEGTSLPYCLMFMAHTLLSALAFNTGGGFSKFTGAYAFLFSVLTVTFGVTWKAVLLQAADSHLFNPMLSISLYTASVAVLLVVVNLNNSLDFRRYSLAARIGVDNVNYTKIGLGCMISAVIIQVLDVGLGAAPGSLLGVINQLNVFLPLGILMATIGAIQNSHGEKGLDVASFLGIGVNIFLGLVSFSKQGMLQPIASWIIAAAYMRFRLRTVHYIALLGAAYFTVVLAGPLSGLRVEAPAGTPYETRIDILIYGLQHLDALKQRDAETAQFALEHSEGASYFGSPQPAIVDRSTMIPVDDPLFVFTNNGHYIGYETILWDFENWIPHFILPDKRTGYTGNYYVHEMGGGIAADDYTTGISFSPVAEAFHVGGWVGIFLLLPALWLLLFTTVDFVAGDFTKSPWGLLVVLLFIHAAPESLLSGMIQYIGYGNLALAFAMTFSVKMAPVLASLFTGKDKAAPAPPRRVVMRPSTT